MSVRCSSRANKIRISSSIAARQAEPIRDVCEAIFVSKESCVKTDNITGLRDCKNSQIRVVPVTLKLALLLIVSDLKTFFSLSSFLRHILSRHGCFK